jgi:cytochrome c-type biogenesis protein CcmF
VLADIGSLLTGLALAATVYAALAVFWSIYRSQTNDHHDGSGGPERHSPGDNPWWASGRNAVFAAAALLGLAVLVLLLAFLTDEFSIQYVARHSSRDLSPYLKGSAVWGGQAGSLLLWAFLQALFAAFVAGGRGTENRSLAHWATVFLSLTTVFFVAVTLFLSNPFALSETVPADGQGLNPLLRHPGMVFHPPAMYLGYVGLAVPFALSLAALITRRIDTWPAVARRWTLVAWLFLGLGLLLGMRWAYDVLGWGGYWGWDPVENAGLMPWLTATALLHALVMQDQRGRFRWWNMILTLLSFLLVLFGTFTTRSGLIQSVHAFARSPMGPYFLGAMGVSLVGSLVLFYARRSLLRTPASSDDLLTREGMFTLTLILFLTITASVFVGSVLPTLSDALLDQRFEAGPDWFDRVTGPQLGALVLLMGVCPLLGRTFRALRGLGRRALPAVVFAVLVPVVAALSGFSRPLSLVGLAIVGLAGGTVLSEIAQGVAGRRRRGESLATAFWSLFGHNRRRYGGYLVHLGVILIAVGVIGTRFYAIETEAVVTSGDSIEVEGYTLVFEGLDRVQLADRTGTSASVAVYRGGRYVRTLNPTLEEYSSFGQTIAIPAVLAALREDLYLVLAGWTGGGAQVTLKIFVNPLASFLWLGGLVFLAGGAIAVWPSARHARLPVAEVRRRRQWSAAGLIAGVALLALAVWAMWGGTQGTGASSSRSSSLATETSSAVAGRPRVGDPAPAFTVSTLDGSQLRLADLRGQVAVINFWSPDCKPCEDELPALQAMWEEYQAQGVAFVGISVPHLADEVRAMVADFGITYPNALDLATPAQYGITGVPETFLIGSDGRVAYVHIGPLSAQLLGDKLAAVLAQ